MVLQKSASIKLNTTNSKSIVPPSPPRLPFVGLAPFFGKHLHLELHKLAKKYGNVFQLNVGSRKILILNGLDTIKEALVNHPDSFNARADFDIYKKSPQCFFMELKSGEYWKKHRAIFIQVLHGYFNSKSDMLEKWALEEASDLADVFLNFGAKAFDPNSYIPLATLSFIQRLLFDKKGSLDNSQEDTDFVAFAHGRRKLADGVLTFTNLLEIVPVIWRPVFALFKQKLIRGFFKGLLTVEGYLPKNIEQHQKTFDPEKLRDLTDAFLKASSEQTESDRKNFRLTPNDLIKGTLSQIAGPGTEFPRVILHWCLLYMIVYPDIQAEIHKELDEVVGKEQQICLNHRSKLPFTEACINEILRHASPTNLPSVTYGTVKNTTFKGYFIPEKTPVFVNYYSVTRDERYWEEPEQFNPYRFLDENGKLRKELLEKFYPFGIGQRRCIGEYLARLQIFLFFTNLMHKCEFKKVAGDKLSLEPEPGVFAGPKNYRVTAKSRL